MTPKEIVLHRLVLINHVVEQTVKILEDKFGGVDVQVVNCFRQQNSFALNPIGYGINVYDGPAPEDCVARGNGASGSQIVSWEEAELITRTTNDDWSWAPVIMFTSNSVDTHDELPHLELCPKSALLGEMKASYTDELASLDKSGALYGSFMHVFRELSITGI